jgi:GntR family galactonate operon transcriptional repressor
LDLRGPEAGILRPEGAAAALGRRIVSGDLRPGSTLPRLEDLAEQFSISRLSMREAIKLLSAKGLVSSAPRRGTVVHPRNKWSRLDPDVLVWQVGDLPNAAFVRSLFEARAIIEPEAAALVALRANDEVLAAIERAFRIMASTDPRSVESIEADAEFHQGILTGTGNEFIGAFAPVIGAWLKMAFRVQRIAAPEQDHFVPHHAAILESIKRGDAEGARSAFRVLLTQAESDALRGVGLRDQIT